MVWKPQMNYIQTLTKQVTQQNSKKPKPTCHHGKNQVTIKTNAANSNKERTRPELTRIVLTMTTIITVVVRQTPTPTPTKKFSTIPTQTIQIIKKTENLDLCTHPVRPVVKLTIPQIIVTLEQIQRTDRLTGTDDRRDNTKSNRDAQSNSDGNVHAAAQTNLETPRLHSGAAYDRPETIVIPKFPPIPEVVWQQASETSTNQFNLKNPNNDSTIYYIQETSKTTVSSQTSPPKGTQRQKYLVATEHTPGNQTENEPVPFLDCSQKHPTDIQNSEQHVTTTLIGDTTIPPLTIRAPLIEEGLVSDEETNEIYLPLTTTVVLKQKQEMLCVPLDFEKILAIDALVDSGPFVSAIA